MLSAKQKCECLQLIARNIIISGHCPSFGSPGHALEQVCCPSMGWRWMAQSVGPLDALRWRPLRTGKIAIRIRTKTAEGALNSCNAINGRLNSSVLS